MKKIYFLGPKGTYSEFAAKKIVKFLCEDFLLIPISTIAKILDLVSKNEDDLAILPIENSIEGIVRPTLDNIYLKNVKINLQTEIAIEHCLIAKSEKTKIKHIASHPQALAQCQNYIVQNFDENIDLIETSSTAAAANILKENDEGFAIIASNDVAQENNFEVIEENIADIKNNKTRFVLVSKNELSLENKNRTSIVFNTKNEPGALFEILEIFKQNNLNLIYLESRPSRVIFGEYNFFVDIDAGADKIKHVLYQIEKRCNYYCLLGSYPTV